MINKQVFDENGKCYIFVVVVVVFSTMFFVAVSSQYKLVENFLLCFSAKKKHKKTQDVSFSTPDMLFTTYRYLNRQIS